MSEDERLEYSCLWMDAANRPKNLTSLLSRKYLLILGCGYENWLARFFLFGLKGTELFSNIWDASGLLADSHAPSDVQLERFLSRCHGNIYSGDSVGEFVDELERRIAQAPLHDERETREECPPGSVFISYASEDRAAALQVKDCLEKLDIPVWLDLNQLDSGEDYDAKIRRNIRKSSFFLPILSRTTATITGPRYFRVEWSVAAEEARRRSPATPFVHPVAIDDVKPCDNIPEFMNSLHWSPAPGGALDERMIDRMVELFERYDG